MTKDSVLIFSTYNMDSLIAKVNFGKLSLDNANA